MAGANPWPWDVVSPRHAAHAVGLGVVREPRRGRLPGPSDARRAGDEPRLLPALPGPHAPPRPDDRDRDLCGGRPRLGRCAPRRAPALRRVDASPLRRGAGRTGRPRASPVPDVLLLRHGLHGGPRARVRARRGRRLRARAARRRRRRGRPPRPDADHGNRPRAVSRARVVARKPRGGPPARTLRVPRGTRRRLAARGLRPLLPLLLAALRRPSPLREGPAQLERAGEVGSDGPALIWQAIVEDVSRGRLLRATPARTFEGVYLLVFLVVAVLLVRAGRRPEALYVALTVGIVFASETFESAGRYVLPAFLRSPFLQVSRDARGSSGLCSSSRGSRRPFMCGPSSTGTGPDETGRASPPRSRSPPGATVRPSRSGRTRRSFRSRFARAIRAARRGLRRSSSTNTSARPARGPPHALAARRPRRGKRASSPSRPARPARLRPGSRRAPSHRSISRVACRSPCRPRSWTGGASRPPSRSRSSGPRISPARATGSASGRSWTRRRSAATSASRTRVSSATPCPSACASGLRRLGTGELLHEATFVLTGLPLVIDDPWKRFQLAPGTPFDVEATFLGSARSRPVARGMWLYGITALKSTGASRFLETRVVRGSAR